MAYAFVQGSAQYFSATLASALDHPCTLAAWVYLTTSRNQAVLSINNTSNNYRRTMQINATTNAVAMNSTDTSSNGAATTAGGSVGVYFHAGGVNAAANSRSAYIDGANKVSNTNTRNPGAISTLGIGAAYVSGWATTFNGRIAEAAVWSAALTDDEMVSLGKGFRPTRIRPQSLVFYAPLVREQIETRGGIALTASASSPTVADHPRVY